MVALTSARVAGLELVAAEASEAAATAAAAPCGFASTAWPALRGEWSTSSSAGSDATGGSGGVQAMRGIELCTVGVDGLTGASDLHSANQWDAIVSLMSWKRTWLAI